MYAFTANNRWMGGGACDHASNSKHTGFGKIVSIIASFISLAVKQNFWVLNNYKAITEVSVVSCIRNK
jgi:hypothetical protein